MDIKTTRYKLQYIDNQIKNFFIERMKIIKIIKNIKEKNNIRIYDYQREKFLINKLLISLKQNYPLNILYKDLLENMFKISKIYQILNTYKYIQLNKIFISNIFYIKNIKKKFVQNYFNKNIKFINSKNLNCLIYNILNIKDSIGIINYNYINHNNINDFIKKIQKKKISINIYNQKNYYFFIIKGKP